MRDIPILVLLSFPKANYDNPKTQGMSLIVVNAVLAGLVLIAVALRLYTRIWLKRWVGSDDYTIILATIFTIGLNIVVILANAKYYWDRHIWDIPIDKIHSVGKIAMAAKALFVCAAFFTRLSLLCFYYRLTVDTGLKRYRWTLHSAMIFNTLLFLAFMPLSIFQCRPIRAYWEFPSRGVCVDEGKVTLAAGITNCIADLLVTILPIPMIMRTKMPLKQRLFVCVLLGLGIIVTIAGIIRTYFIWKALIDSYDQTWYAYPLWICAAVEIDLAVLCACAPTLRPLLIKVAGPILSSLSSMYDKGVSGYGSRTHGVLTSNATGRTPTLDGNTVISSQVDYELEKIDATVDVQESSRSPGPKRKWSTSWANSKSGSDEIEPAMSPRLVINASQTFEVRHEDRSQGASATRIGQDSYIRLDDSAQDLRNQWLGLGQPAADRDLGHRPDISSFSNSSSPSGSNIKFSAHPSSAPLSPATGNVAENKPSLLDRNVRPSEQKAVNEKLGVQQSFFIAPSNDGASSGESVKSGQWPLRPATAESSKPEVRNGERRWDIERNPFRDTPSGQKSPVSVEPRRATTSPRPERARWGSSGDVWEDIEARKKSLSIERSNSRREQVRGGSRIP